MKSWLDTQVCVCVCLCLSVSVSVCVCLSVCLSVYFGSQYTFLYFIDFLDRCLKDCLLTNREVVELTNRLVQCCLDFANHMQVQV